MEKQLHILLNIQLLLYNGKKRKKSTIKYINNYLPVT